MDMLEAPEKLAHLVSVRFLAKGGRTPLPSVLSVPSRSFWLVLLLHDSSLVSWFIVVCPCRCPGLNCVGRSSTSSCISDEMCPKSRFSHA